MKSDSDFRKTIFSTPRPGKKLKALIGKKQPSQVVILTDDNTWAHCLPLLLEEADFLRDAKVIRVYAGEQHKNIRAAEYIWQQLTLFQADRNSLLLNLGGGMICDLGGFAAATYKRGFPFMHIPTSLLAMADAAIGGKLGIDFMNYKNQVGVFRHPAAIVISTPFLKSLSSDQMVSGFAEIVKHGLLAGGAFWKEIKSAKDLSVTDWGPFILESVAFKSGVVLRDPFEKGVRKVLNFGHTVGHALESFLMNTGRETLHGFCVAAGMVGELYLSSKWYGLPESVRDEALDVIRTFFPRMAVPENELPEIIRLMQQDKKNKAGSIRMVLLERPGRAVPDAVVEENQIHEALLFMNEFYDTF